jgi:hypothetical protein
MGTSTTGATGRFPALARLLVALGFAATLLVGQAVAFDSSASAKTPLDIEYDKLCEIVGCGNGG